MVEHVGPLDGLPPRRMVFVLGGVGDEDGVLDPQKKSSTCLACSSSQFLGCNNAAWYRSMEYSTQRKNNKRDLASPSNHFYPLSPSARSGKEGGSGLKFRSFCLQSHPVKLLEIAIVPHRFFIFLSSNQPNQL